MDAVFKTCYTVVYDDNGDTLVTNQVFLSKEDAEYERDNAYRKYCSDMKRLGFEPFDIDYKFRVIELQLH